MITDFAFLAFEPPSNETRLRIRCKLIHGPHWPEGMRFAIGEQFTEKEWSIDRSIVTGIRHIEAWAIAILIIIGGLLRFFNRGFLRRRGTIVINESDAKDE